MIDFSFKKGALVELLTNSHTFVGRIIEFPQSNTEGRLIIEPQLLVSKETCLGTVPVRNAYHVDPESVITWRYAKAENLGQAKVYVSGEFIKFDDNGFSKKL